jgi:hypothetical protein
MKLNRIRVAGFALMALVFLGTPAFAQVDLTGIWAPLGPHEDTRERNAGPDVGDYLGLPVNDAGRMRGETWNASILTMYEHTCKPHPSIYGFRGVGNLRMTYNYDPVTYNVTKIDTHIQWMEQKREIWMDGRPHPPAWAPHTWQGFSTGRWEGTTLVVTTTHLKASWVRRNGIATSDQATHEEHFIRHGDVMTHVSIVTDPVYFTEPLIRTNGFRLNSNAVAIQPYPCYAAEEVQHVRGTVPHWLPAQSTAVKEFSEEQDLPEEASRGGAATMYPEFMKKFIGRPAPQPRGGRGSGI